MKAEQAMATQTDRRAIHAYVTDEAHDCWHDFAAEQGVSVSAVLEALASQLGTTADMAAVLDDVVTNARRIDATRRRRRS